MNTKWVIAGLVVGLLSVSLAEGALITPAEAQSPDAHQNNQSGPNLLAPGNGNQFYLASPPSTAPALNLPPVTGLSIANSGGGTGADITALGSAGSSVPVIGKDIQMNLCSGQSATGVSVIQNGPGTGMKVTVGGDGPATGVRSAITVRNCGPR
jgi:hypothetical protein